MARAERAPRGPAPGRAQLETGGTPIRAQCPWSPARSLAQRWWRFMLRGWFRGERFRLSSDRKLENESTVIECLQRPVRLCLFPRTLISSGAQVTGVSSSHQARCSSGVKFHFFFYFSPAAPLPPLLSAWYTAAARPSVASFLPRKPNWKRTVFGGGMLARIGRK